LIAEREFAVPLEFSSMLGGPRWLSDGAWQMQTSDSRLVVFDAELGAVQHTFELPYEGVCAARLDVS
jgi:hypothetical protein